MTYRVDVRTILAAAVIVLSGCNGSSSSPPAAIPNISGDYVGSVQDSVLGAAAVTGTLAQHGGSAGGGLVLTAGSATQNVAYSVVVDSSNAISGTMVEDLASGTTCTFSTSGNYNPSTNQISGSYTAVTNCSGQNGTYTLTQQCFDTVTSLHRRTMTILKC
jgi:hypothetical protein